MVRLFARREWLALAMICVVGNGGCETTGSRQGVVARGPGEQKRVRTVEITLVSNQENTSFYVRYAGGGWTPVGKGKILTTRIPRDLPSELAAKPDGFRRKELALPSPVHQLSFTFWDPADREKGAPQANRWHLSCDIRLIRVADGSVLVSASDQGLTDAMEPLARTVVDKIRNSGSVEGKRIAVVSFRNRAGTDRGQAYADELADKITGELVSVQQFDVKERVNLRAILEEKDLETAMIVHSPAVAEKLSDVQYVIIGGVTVTEIQQ